MGATTEKIRGLASGALSLLSAGLFAAACSAPEQNRGSSIEFKWDFSKMAPEGCQQAPVHEAENVTFRCAIEYGREHYLVVDWFFGADWFSESELKGARVEQRAIERWMGWIEAEVARSAPGWTERHFRKRPSRRLPKTKTADAVRCLEYEREFENRRDLGHGGVGFITRSRWLVCGERTVGLTAPGIPGQASKLAVVGVKDIYAPKLGHAPLPQFDRIVDEVFSAFTW